MGFLLYRGTDLSLGASPAKQGAAVRGLSSRRWRREKGSKEMGRGEKQKSATKGKTGLCLKELAGGNLAFIAPQRALVAAEPSSEQYLQGDGAVKGSG